MPAPLTTRAQVNGYRFLLQRYAHAMVRRDIRMLHDPMRIQFRSLMTGIVLAVLVTAGAAILSFLRPQGQVGDAKIVMGSESGALYAVVNGTLHPVLNLASARLIAGDGAAPTSVKDAKLAAMPRGPLLGIPGAPAALPGPVDKLGSAWTLCEEASAGMRATVLVGSLELGPRTRRAAAGEALLGVHENITYLIYDGKHTRVEMADEAIISTLPQLRGLRARPIGAGLLNATVPVPELRVPPIPEAGTPSRLRGHEFPVGSVIRVQDVHTQSDYVVLADGVQRVSEFTAHALRSADSYGLTTIPKLAPDAIRGIPVVDSLPVQHFPSTDLTVISADTDPIACVSWTKADAEHEAGLGLLLGETLPLTGRAAPMALVASTNADAVAVPPASGEYLQVTGIEPGSNRRDGLFYVTDTGVRFGIPDAATATLLGLGSPKAAPWQIVNQLPAGPMLDRQSALIARDIVGAGPA
ncbi:type VII secretion protein EccB [Nocardia sp. NPDC003979]